MSQQDILPLLTHEWQTTAQIVKAAGRLDPPCAEGTVKNNLLQLQIQKKLLRFVLNMHKRVCLISL